MFAKSGGVRHPVHGLAGLLSDVERKLLEGPADSLSTTETLLAA